MIMKKDITKTLGQIPVPNKKQVLNFSREAINCLVTSIRNKKNRFYPPNTIKTSSYLNLTELKMPCANTCDTRRLLLAKESRLSKLHQTKNWIEELGRLEPQRGEEIGIKLKVVNDKILETKTDVFSQISRTACRPWQMNSDSHQPITFLAIYRVITPTIICINNT